MKTEECEWCSKQFYERVILSLEVTNWFTGLEINEPTFLIFEKCWQKLKKQL